MDLQEHVTGPPGRLVSWQCCPSIDYQILPITVKMVLIGVNLYLVLSAQRNGKSGAGPVSKVNFLKARDTVRYSAGPGNACHGTDPPYGPGGSRQWHAIPAGSRESAGFGSYRRRARRVTLKLSRDTDSRVNISDSETTIGSDTDTREREPFTVQGQPYGRPGADDRTDGHAAESPRPGARIVGSDRTVRRTRCPATRARTRTHSDPGRGVTA
eukprot:767494-Hanusia_phi.AAC.1